ncbi:Putative NADPH-quinone reductase (modulator of drug activity B) [Sphingomonas gellani]|uniref:Putative NADPH-quinone reductase (Modulator of drug activity B) n=1 Tax=Sphingomonas gellani TaxID=1166340 RepID=A0A1H8J6C2_9SPHN|nr:NAD(P)H-dependent oxidoreductase [Sphingomonas gellani]SEN76292.1 Putative NADPH-quinone reductase (modulator of drug activity B) [Sphingomonas gellani]
MRTTILLFHPAFARSKANRALADAAVATGDVDLVVMDALYPSGELDVEAEVGRLLSVERLVLQFPVQWYSTPPLLKAWQDTVLTRMYYVNAATEGERLRDLPVMVAATAGNDPSAYAADGVNLFPLPDLLRPLQATAHRCFWRWHEPFLIYRANKSSPEELAAAGDRYAARLAGWA